MTYKQTLDYLYEQLPMFHRIGAAAYKADLKNTIALCKMLGNPERKFKSVHIAGTNGKGSTSHMLAAILQTAGYKTGLYTSPHLLDFRERIRINGEMIPKKEVTDFVEKHQRKFEKIEPSFFEWTVALCFDYFAREKVDIAIIETGLGGRLDSTNVITPLVSVITNIGWDHADLLGDTLEKIAKEKAGIMKPKVPVVIGEENAKLRNILISYAKKTKSPCHTPKLISTIRKGTTYMGFSGFDINIPGVGKLPLFLDLAGDYQKKNIIPAVYTAQLLEELGYNITTFDVVSAFTAVQQLTGLRGRWERISDSPLTICDVGHNKDGIKEVVKQIKRTPHKHLHAVIGFVKDKNVDDLLKLFPKDATYYFCKAELPRAMDENILRGKAKKYKLNGQAYSSVKAALAKAQKAAKKNDLIFVGGSTFIVAEILPPKKLKWS